MTAAALTPRVRLMAICDGVRESKTESGVFDLKGLRQRIVASELPFAPSRLWLFVIVSSPRRGEYPCYIRVINDATDKTVYYANWTPSFRFDGENETLPRIVRLRALFPDVGRYTIQVWFFQERGSDILKGEVSLSVTRQGD